MTGIIGQKIGMTQVFSADGAAQPVTVLKAGPCVVVQRKSADRDGYDAVQLGLVEDRPARVSRPVAGLYARANVPPTRVRRELPITGDDSGPAEGEQVLATLFETGDQVDVTGVSRGRRTVRCTTVRRARSGNPRIRRVSFVGCVRRAVWVVTR